MAKRTTKKTPETLLKESVCRHLKKKEDAGELVFWRSSAGLAFTRFGRPIRVGRTGMPDILVLRSGVLYGLELKSPTGRLEDSQKEMKPLLEAAGCVYHVIRSTEELKKVIS